MMHSRSRLATTRRKPASRRRVIAPWMLATLLTGLAIVTPRAQSPVCNQIRTELASLSTSQLHNNPQAARVSAQLRTELNRVRLAMQQNNCGRSGFFIFNAPPPICSPLTAQAAQLEAQIRQVEGGGAGAQNPRRAQLLAAYERYNCMGGDAPRPPRGIIYAGPSPPSLSERLFGTPFDPPAQSQVIIDPEFDSELKERARLGGRMAICVRMCDGFFFPVNFEGISARDEQGAVCASLCPSAETRVFYMPGGADLDRAATREGAPYSAIPNAFRYRQTRDATCTCKEPQQTWAQAMAGVDDLVEARKGDILVTPEQAAAMSRPKGLPGTKTPPKDAKGRVVAAEPEPIVKESEIPIAGNASSGIGPRAAGPRLLDTQQGTKHDMLDENGVRRQVRVVAPALSPGLRGEVTP